MLIMKGIEEEMAQEEKYVPLWRKCTLTIDEAAEYSNIGKNKLSELLRFPRCSYYT